MKNWGNRAGRGIKYLLLHRALRDSFDVLKIKVAEFKDDALFYLSNSSWTLRSSVLLFAILLTTALVMRPAVAATETLVPNGDVQGSWPELGGTNDGTCVGSLHCNYVDEPTDNDADYVGTGTSGAGGEVEEFDLTTANSVQSATQVIVTIRSFTATLGSTADTLSVRLWVSGTYQTAVTITPSSTAFTNQDVTFTGNWSQADVDSMSVYISRTVVGGGPGAGRDDDIRISRVYATVTYTQAITYNQSSYRWFSNDEASVNPATPLTATNAPASPAASVVRLRSLVKVGNGTAGVGSANLKLQYAQKSGTCDASYSGETYADLSSSTPIAFADNPSLNDDALISATANDPTNATTVVPQTYVESNPFSSTSSISAGQSGLWDFAITIANAPGSTSYCLRVVDNSGATLATPEYIAELTTPTPTAAQNNWRAYEPGSGSGSISAQTIGGTNADTYSGVTSGGTGIYAVGNTYSFGVGGSDANIAKYDENGNIIWDKVLGEADPDAFNDVDTDVDGNVYAAGTSGGFLSEGALLAKYDSAGNLLWNRMTKGTGRDLFHSVAVAGDGSVYAAGSTTSYSASGLDTYLVKYSSTGSILWSRMIGGVNEEEFFDIALNSDGSIIAAGYTFSYGGASSHDALLAKYDSTGTLQWARTAGGSGEDQFHAVSIAGDGNIYAAGHTGSFGAGSNDGFIMKYDASGAALWSRTLGGANNDYFRGLTVTNDGNVFASGHSNSYGAGLEQALTVKYDTSGSMTLTTAFGDTGADFYSYDHTIVGSNLLSIGSTKLTSSFYGDSLYAKYGLDGLMSGCSNKCTNPTPSVASPSVSTASITASTSSPAPTATTPSLTAASITPTYATLVSPAPEPGAPLAVQNAAATINAGDSFRLRQLLEQTAGSTQLDTGTYKLQSAVRGADNICDTSFTGETYGYVHPSPLNTGFQQTATTIVSDSAAGTMGWFNPEQAGVNDNLFAYSTGTLSVIENSGYLKATNYGLSIPDNATITGIEVQAEKDDPVSGASVSSVAVVKGGAIQTGTTRGAGTTWAGTHTYGGTADLWGNTWTPADVNGVGFGVAIAATMDGTVTFSDPEAHVDYLSVNVHYTVPAVVTSITYNTTTGITSGTTISTHANDPTAIGTINPQTFVSTDPFSNSVSAVASGESAMWDFAVSTTAEATGSYCFRVVKSDGSLLSSYSQIPEITIAGSGGGPTAPTLDQQVRGGQSVVNGVRAPFSW